MRAERIHKLDNLSGSTPGRSQPGHVTDAETWPRLLRDRCAAGDVPPNPCRASSRPARGG